MGASHGDDLSGRCRDAGVVVRFLAVTLKTKLSWCSRVGIVALRLHARREKKRVALEPVAFCADSLVMTPLDVIQVVVSARPLVWASERRRRHRGAYHDVPESGRIELS